MLRLGLIVLGLLGGAWLGGRRRLLATIEPAGGRAGTAVASGSPVVGGGAGPVRISVVVPARDEERNLPRLLGSLAAQQRSLHEVVVVDDGSTDRTAEVAAAHGATVRTAPPRPEGWLGKPWACHVGAGATTGTHLLFLDADVSLAPDAVARLVASHGRGLLTVQPRHRTERAYEQLSLFPNVVALLGTGVAAVGGRPGMRGAFGPCLLTDRAAYEAAGGHAAVAGELVEDLALGDAYRAAGLPVEGRLGGDTVTYRMYPDGPAQLVEGWTKNLAAGAGRTGRVAALTTTAWVAACAATATWLATTLLAWLLADGAAPVVALLAYALVAAELAWLANAVGRFRRWSLVLWPVPLAAFVVLFLRSALRTALRRPVRWRGRSVPSRPTASGPTAALVAPSATTGATVPAEEPRP